MIPNGRKTLESVEIVRRRKDDSYGLKVSYLIENDYEVHRVTFPFVRLNIWKDNFIYTDNFESPEEKVHRVDIGINDCDFTGTLERGNVEYFEDIYCHDKLIMIKQSTKEMTLEEIEKKLGHKIKIITKEDKTKS